MEIFTSTETIVYSPFNSRYVDAQRDVAVDMGERDIRREILKHR